MGRQPSRGLRRGTPLANGAMNLLTSILVTIDFSDAANEAARRAAQIAPQNDARLTLLNVVDPSRFKGPRALISPASTPRPPSGHDANGTRPPGGRLGLQSKSMLHSATALAPAASLHALHPISPGWACLVVPLRPPARHGSIAASTPGVRPRCKAFARRPPARSACRLRVKDPSRE